MHDIIYQDTAVLGHYGYNVGSDSPGANLNLAKRTASLEKSVIIRPTSKSHATHFGGPDEFETLQVYWTFRSSTLGLGKVPGNEPLGLPGEFGAEFRSCRDKEPRIRGSLGVCLTKLQVPQGSPGPRADSACTLNLIVVRGEKSDTTIA